MEPNPPDVVYCQSCGMPMETSEDHGTEQDGVISEEYCRYCYQNGEFTNPEMTLQQMIDFNVRLFVEHMGWSEEDARAALTPFISSLKRWR